MRRQSQREVEAAARRRLELLQRELEQAGLSRLGDRSDLPHDDDEAFEESVPRPDRTAPDAPPGVDAPAPPLPPATPVAPAGRHRRREATLGDRVSARVAAVVADRLPDTLRGHVGLQLGPVLLVLGLVATAVLAGLFVLARSGADSRPVPPPRVAASASALPLATPATGASGAASSVAAPSPSGSAPGSSSGSVTVDLAGKVRRPGVVTLPAGSRVVDALKRAGGARAGADLNGLNLARVLVDGEQIVVGQPPVPGGVAAGVASGAPAPTGALVNLNTATEEQLDTLPGVGPVTAQKILEWRTDHGAFTSVDELLEIDGIGEKTFADLAPLVTL